MSGLHNEADRISVVPSVVQPVQASMPDGSGRLEYLLQTAP
jgi:hypothetical protein